MKKSNFWKLLSGTAFFAAVALASCVDDNDDKGMPYLEVTPDVLTFNADGAPEGASAFTVKSNRPWTLEVLEGSDWVTPSATQGSGDGTVEFTIPASNVGRIAKLSFNLKNAYGAYWTKEVTIEQGEAPKAGEVSALVAYIKNTWPSLESGTEELNYSQKTIPAVILANNEGGNLYQVISLVDNTGEAKSGIITAASVCYWLVTTAVFMIYTYGHRGNAQPQSSWIIWAVAGVLYGAVMLLLRTILTGRRDK